MIGSKLASRPLWVISRNNGCRLETFLCEDATILPVFCFEEEADLYLRAETPSQAGWLVRQTTLGELTSMLYSSCSGARFVALDPLPTDFGLAIRPALVSREEILHGSSKERYPRGSGRTAPLAASAWAS